MGLGRQGKWRKSFLFQDSLKIFTLHTSNSDGSYPGSFSQSNRSKILQRLEASAVVHNSSIQRPGLRFCGVTFLTGLLPDLFLEKFAQARARLVQLRFRVSYRTSHDVRNFVVLIPLDVVEYKNGPVARRKFLNGTLEIHPADCAG